MIAWYQKRKENMQNKHLYWYLVCVCHFYARERDIYSHHKHTELFDTILSMILKEAIFGSHKQNAIRKFRNRFDVKYACEM